MAGSRALRIRRLIPWVVAAGILAYVVARVPGAELVAALARVSAWQLGVLAALFVPAMLAADSLALRVAVRAAVPDRSPSYLDIVRVRGASYLLALVNFAAGQGGVVYFLRRRHGIAVATGAGAVLLSTAAGLLVMALLVATALLAGAVPDRRELTVAALALLALTPLHLLVVAARPAVLMRSRWLAPMFDAGVVGTLRITAARCLHAAVLIAGHFTAMHLFGIPVPATVALAGLPVVFLIATLPISPSGLGTTQAAAITLFASFAPGATQAAREAAVLAYSLGFQVANTAVIAAIGLACLRLGTADDEPPSQE